MLGLKTGVISVVLPPGASGCCFSVPATTEIYTLSLHDALPIFVRDEVEARQGTGARFARERTLRGLEARSRANRRSEEHTSELQSLTNLVCRLLLEKKKR